MKLPEDYEILREIAKRARGTKRCQLCGASYVKNQEHEPDCPIKDWIQLAGRPEIREAYINPKVVEFEALVSNGLKIIYNGPHTCSISGRMDDGWKPISYIRNITVNLGVDHEPPTVKMEYFLHGEVGTKQEQG